MADASGGGEAVTQWELPAAKAWKAVVLHSPDGPVLLGKLLAGIAVEQLPEGRRENAPGIQEREAHGVEILDLFGLLIHAHPAANTALFPCFF